MTAFKDREIWRRNEQNHVIRYFDNKLGKIMQEKGIKAIKLAEFLGKSSSTVSQWIKGYEMPPSDIQEIIALFLGCQNRAEVWTFKAKRIYNKLVKLNELNRQSAELETEIQKDLEDEGKVTP